MKQDLIKTLHTTFEDVAYENEGVEYWLARDLQTILEYSEWRNFVKVIEKAQTACELSGTTITDHFVSINKTIDIGSGVQRDVSDFMLTRYACYLIAQNGNSAKEPIAFAQTYFAIQTRKQEIIEERLQMVERLQAREKLEATEGELSRLIYEKGIDSSGFGRIRSIGDTALFGGQTTLQMKKKLGVAPNKPLADFLPTITIKAKDFATEITNFNIKKDGLDSEQAITREHKLNNADVRKVLVRRGIKPENLPAEEDIKKLERRVNSEQKKEISNIQKLKKGNNSEDK